MNVRNQCDGCQAGMPMRDIFHVDSNDRSVMICQAGRYVDEDDEVQSGEVQFELLSDDY